MSATPTPGTTPADPPSALETELLEAAIFVDSFARNALANDVRDASVAFARRLRERAALVRWALDDPNWTDEQRWALVILTAPPRPTRQCGMCGGDGERYSEDGDNLGLCPACEGNGTERTPVAPPNAYQLEVTMTNDQPGTWGPPAPAAPPEPTTATFTYHGRHQDCDKHFPGYPHAPCWTVAGTPRGDE